MTTICLSQMHFLNIFVLIAVNLCTPINISVIKNTSSKEYTPRDLTSIIGTLDFAQ